MFIYSINNFAVEGREGGRGGRGELVYQRMREREGERRGRRREGRERLCKQFWCLRWLFSKDVSACAYIYSMCVKR